MLCDREGTFLYPNITVISKQDIITDVYTYIHHVIYVSDMSSVVRAV